MAKKPLRFAAGLLAAAVSASAALIGTNTPAPSITAERIATLPESQQGVWRDYLDRSVRQMQADRAFFQAELKAAGLVKAVIPAEGRGASSVPIDEAAAWYATPEARRIADIVISFQTPAGGWSKNLNMANHLRRPGEFFTTNNISRYLGPDDFDAPRDRTWNYVGTFDNDATSTQLHFLAKVTSALDEKTGAPYRAAFLRGLNYVFAAQFPNGGWPQVWPLEGSYHDTITYNDAAMIETIQILQEVAEGSHEFAFADAALRARAAASVERGLNCIVATQIVTNGRRTVWCQQHDALTLEPRSGRNYEPPVPCGSESAELMIFLMDLPRPSPAVVASVHAAAAWFKETAIMGWGWKQGPDRRHWVPVPGAGPVWARYYESGTDRPIFGDRDKSLHDDVNDLSTERLRGYQWFGTRPKEALDRYARWSRAHPAPSA